MNKSIVFIIALMLVIFCVKAYADGDAPSGSTASSTASSVNQINTSQNQNMQGQGYGYGEGGSASASGGNAKSDSDSIAISGDSGAIANISTNSTSNYQSRTPPVAMFPPYLPTFSHGGWGTIQGYFPNGPTSDNRIYECAFYPGDDYDMKELKGVLKSLSYEGPLSFIGGLLNGVGVLFGGPDNFHHGRGFEISNSVIRRRRPNDRPLIILIDSQINKDYLKTNGFAYVGKVSLEGKINRNWDHVYKAAIAEVLPWDVDIMLISGGMKGVTVGSNFTFPSAGGAYSQTNYSMTLLGGRSTGITEGKGEAMVSAECYRYYPQAVRRRTVPESFYDNIHVAEASTPKDIDKITEYENVQLSTPTAVPTKQQNYKGVNVSQELYDMAGFNQ